MDINVARDVDAQLHVPHRVHRSDNRVQWRSTTEGNSEDEAEGVPDPEDEVVENLLRPHTEIAGFSNLMGERNADKEHSMAEHSERNTMPDSNEDDDMSSNDPGDTAVQTGKQEMTVQML